MEQWKDTPNIGPVLAENLKRIGVAAPEQLRELGAEDAFARIRAQVVPTACLHQLEALAGAVTTAVYSMAPRRLRFSTIWATELLFWPMAT